MVYRSTHHHATWYHAGEKVRYEGEEGTVIEGGYKFGFMTIRWRGAKVQFGPYDEWPEKQLTPAN